jgi:hypothetical protein
VSLRTAPPPAPGPRRRFPPATRADRPPPRPSVAGRSGGGAGPRPPFMETRVWRGPFGPPGLRVRSESGLGPPGPARAPRTNPSQWCRSDPGRRGPGSAWPPGRAGRGPVRCILLRWQAEASGEPWSGRLRVLTGSESLALAPGRVAAPPSPSCHACNGLLSPMNAIKSG